jgi:nicotinamidase-related amidase
VLLDLHYGTLSNPLWPYGADQVVKNATALGRGFEAFGAMIVLTRMVFPRADRPDQDSEGLPLVSADSMPPGWSTFTPAVRSLRADLTLTKRKWSAFQGTDLDSRLRRRRITTLVLAGVTTHVAVEFTARDAWQRNYSVIIAEDAVASIDPAFHQFSVEKVLPRIAAVCATTDIVTACSRPALGHAAGKRASHARLPVRALGGPQSVQGRS